MQAALALTADGPAPGRRRRKAAPRWILAVSLLAHAAILAALVRGVPIMGPLVEPPVVDIELLRPDQPDPVAPAASAPATLPPSVTPKLLRRPLAAPAPILAPTVAPGPPTEAIAPPGFKARGLTGGGEALREATREGIGCRNAEDLGLTKAQKAACAEKLGEQGKNAPLYAVLDPEKKAAFDGACKKDDEWCLYRSGKGPYPGLLAIGRKRKIKGWD